MKYKTPQSIDIEDNDFLDPSRLRAHGLDIADFVHYTGSSMYPTFHDPEFLIVEKPDYQDLTIGDIIIFKVSYMDKLVIHRIVAMRNRQFITKGDNNTYLDPEPVDFRSIFGRAAGIVTRTGTRTVWNGRRGRMLVRIHRLRAFVKKRIVKPLIWNSFTIRYKNVVSRAEFITPDYVVFNNRKGVFQIRLIWRKRTIGYYDVLSKKFFIKRHYRFFVRRPIVERTIHNLLTTLHVSDSGECDASESCGAQC